MDAIGQTAGTASQSGVSEQQAIAALIAVDAVVNVDRDGHAEDVVFQGIHLIPRATDNDLRHLRALPSLKRVVFRGSLEITDDGLVHLQGIRTLRSLELSTPDFSDKGLSHCTGLVALEELILRGPQFWGSSLQHFLDSTQLRSLEVLDSSGVWDVNLEYVAKFKKLESVELTLGAFTDRGMIYFGELPVLRRLVIAWGIDPGNISGPGMIYLRHLKHVELLDLSGCYLWDIGVLQLKELTHLKKCVLRNAYANFDVLDEVAQANPSLEIERPEGVASEQRALFHIRREMRGRVIFDTDLKASAVEMIGTHSGRLRLEVFEELSALEELSIFDTNPSQISDASVPALIKLKNLKTLKLKNTLLSPNGIQSLNEGLPGCAISIEDV